MLIETFMDEAPSLAYKTQYGSMFKGTVEAVLASPLAKKYKGKIQLIFTSPPFPLNRKKKYGNFQGQEYIDWLEGVALLLKDYLTEDGSFVMEVGNAWEQGSPVMSTLALKSLLAVQEKGNLNLCQQFICYNPARLPGPAQWVTIERIRVKDSFTHVWWMSPSSRPKADNRKVLKAYSPSMLRLLESKKYNAGKRASEHQIGETSFLKNNQGAIPSNVLTFANTKANDQYQNYCREHALPAHPARMPAELADFFISFLTDPGDIVLDPFGGSNTTGAAAEKLKRKWVSIEPNEEYILGSKGRFPDTIL
jgi:site-specific DNA-methyltransferase (cytosine-N4-specific)